jgi:hypothetical protein
MRTDGRTHVTNLIDAFLNFAKAPKNVGTYSYDRRLSRRMLDCLPLKIKAVRFFKTFVTDDQAT